LTDDERAGVPWHRVVAGGGKLNRTKKGRGPEQADGLTADWVGVTPRGTVADLAPVLWSQE
jgi:alkylated DNA nucleotide flippase Atl1